MQLYTACFPPFVTTTWSGVTIKPESRLVFSASASLNSGNPPAGLYRWLTGSEIASFAASTICSGVGKSGSPAPNPITGAPAYFSSFALFVTASVADGDMAPTRVDTRDRSDNFPPLSSISLSWYIFRTNADHFIVLKEVLLVFPLSLRHLPREAE